MAISSSISCDGSPRVASCLPAGDVRHVFGGIRAQPLASQSRPQRRAAVFVWNWDCPHARTFSLLFADVDAEGQPDRVFARHLCPEIPFRFLLFPAVQPYGLMGFVSLIPDPPLTAHSTQEECEASRHTFVSMIQSTWGDAVG